MKWSGVLAFWLGISSLAQGSGWSTRGGWPVLDPSDVVNTFHSGPMGGACYALKRFPYQSGAYYKASDDRRERELCSIDFDSPTVGLCSKTWSTSPATIVWDLSETPYRHRSSEFEKRVCSQGKDAPKKLVPGIKRLGAYKQTVSAQFGKNTSATFSQSSLLYYHFSRYFNTTIDVPTSVMRTVSIAAHHDRVAQRGLALATHAMIKNGWSVLVNAYQNPTGYRPIYELFNEPGMMYGMILKGPGDRYGAEWSVEPSRDQSMAFKGTPAFRALMEERPILEAIRLGVAKSKSASSAVARALAGGVSDQQMVLWVEELSEMNILDFIFFQQDRIRNFDYLWKWYFVDDEGRLRSMTAEADGVARSRMASIRKPPEIARYQNAYLVQKTQLIDNDAGAGSVAGGSLYVNKAKQAGYLRDMRHIRPQTYSQLQKLAEDFKNKGDLYRYLEQSFSLAPRYIATIVANTIEAAEILKNLCRGQKLYFDLDSQSYFTSGGDLPHRPPIHCQ